jgi:hypothetical protein
MSSRKRSKRLAMAPAHSRRFTLLDAMVLIGAVALCLVIPSTPRALLPAPTYWRYDVRQYWIIIGSSWLLAVSLALAILAVLVPRPAGRRRFRQPGIVAVVLIPLTLAFNEVQTLGHGVTLYLTTGKAFDNGGFWWVFGPVYDLAFRAGLAVLSGWLTLALTGRWRSAAGWLDRSGRVVGWVWVALGLLAWVIECQTLFNPPNVIPPGIASSMGLRVELSA